ncbi:hypothetical protein P7K49_011560 [Saguinus oedipus]|uniref:Uncharacterized protein n=1 Tax=Saguinus oedipus TaxID=9490 RepID=A0ABQ9VR15_SAGOE|nr:hypothetical protein P7K49_011560 [Saguinus oedipus]
MAAALFTPGTRSQRGLADSGLAAGPPGPLLTCCSHSTLRLSRGSGFGSFVVVVWVSGGSGSVSPGPDTRVFRLGARISQECGLLAEVLSCILA